jgi:PadR family transcriptional regulator PadR
MSHPRCWRDPAAPILPRDFISPCLLLMLVEEPAYGYELLEELGHWGLTKDPGSVYRALHELEHEGLVSSFEEPSDSGPPRRRYRLQAAGRAQLDAWCERLVELQRLVDEFIARYWSTVGRGVIEFRGTPRIQPAPPAGDDGEEESQALTS